MRPLSKGSVRELAWCRIWTINEEVPWLLEGSLNKLPAFSLSLHIWSMGLILARKGCKMHDQLFEQCKHYIQTPLFVFTSFYFREQLEEASIPCRLTNYFKIWLIKCSAECVLLIFIIYSVGEHELWSSIPWTAHKMQECKYNTFQKLHAYIY